jgi:hypothetical protein
MQFAAFTERTFLTVSLLGVLSLPIASRLAVRPLRYPRSRGRRSGFTEPAMASRTSVSRSPAKYQLAILERQKQPGYVLDYTVSAPSLHTSEESRWDCRVVIIPASSDSASD